VIIEPSGEGCLVVIYFTLNDIIAQLLKGDNDSCEEVLIGR